MTTTIVLFIDTFHACLTLVLVLRKQKLKRLSLLRFRFLFSAAIVYVDPY